MLDQRDMSGALFKNNRKEKDSHPDYTGKALIDGYEYQISAWIKTSSKGDKFMSMAYRSTKEERNSSRELDDDIPF